MPATLSNPDRLLLERAVLAPHELSGTERAEVQRLVGSPGPAHRFMEELEAFYGAVEASYAARPEPRPAVRRLARRLLSVERPPRSVRLRLYDGDERPGPYVLEASAVAQGRFVPVAALVGDEADLVVRLVQDVEAEECIVYVVASPERRAYALIESDALPAPLVTDPRGRAAFECPAAIAPEALDQRVAVHPALCAERIVPAAFDEGAVRRVEAADGGGEAALLSLREGVLSVAPADGYEPFRWLVLQLDEGEPQRISLREGWGEAPWSGGPATLRGYA